MRRLIALAVVVTAVPTAAEERTWPVASFDRLRVEGPIDVDVTRGSPAARAAGDRATLTRLSIVREGMTLVVRLAGAPPAGLAAADATLAPVRVALATPRLAAVTHQGTGRVTVARLDGDRVDVAATGGGAVAVAAVETRLLAATIVGGGGATLAGRAARARLTLNGDGAVDAAALVADEASVSLVGAGEIRAAARFAAQVVAGPAEGRVTVTGRARCAVRSTGKAQVRCGAG